MTESTSPTPSNTNDANPSTTALQTVDAAPTLDDFDRIGELCAALRQQLRRVIVGQDAIVEQLLVALLSQGHVLVVGVPGLAKTLLVRTLAEAMDLSFRRIQFTPDMMPSDILGTELIQEHATEHGSERQLRFMPGPIFAQLILADEINRTPPKTQAALLEAMAEHQVTIAGRSMRLEEPFIVVATQNPIEQEGTYPLPEAQLDRFMLSLWMDYPSKDEEIEIVANTPRIMSEQVEQVFDRATLLRSIAAVAAMPVSRHVVDYAVSLARATRPAAQRDGDVGSARGSIGGTPVASGGDSSADTAAPEITARYVEWGAGPRAGQCLVQAAKALAAMAGEPTPSTKHVKQAALPVLRHRVVPNYAAAGDGITPRQIIDAVVEAVKPASYE